MSVEAPRVEWSEYNRPVIYLAQWSHYGGKATGTCAFTTAYEAIRYARSNARGFVKWENFPDSAREYPYDDRTGFERPPLTPLYRVQWGDGYSQVTRTEVDDKFRSGNPCD